jgi:excisionase family DNA binding protein
MRGVNEDQLSRVPLSLPVLPRLYTKKQVCQMVGVCRATIDKMLKTGEIPHVYIHGRALRITHDDFMAWVDKMRITSKSDRARLVFNKKDNFTRENK